MAVPANTIHTGIRPETLQEGLYEVFDEGYALDKEPSQAVSSDIFNMKMSKKASESDLKKGRVGEFTAPGEGEVTPKEVINELHKTTYSHDTFRRSVHITYEALQDQLYSEMQSEVKDLGEAARFTQEKNRFGVFRNITTTNGGSGKPLAAADHALSTGTQGNIVTGTFTTVEAAQAKVKEAITKFRRQKDYNLKSIPGKPSILLTSITLHALMVEATKSKLIPGSNNNEPNYISELFPGLKVMWSPYYGSEYGGSDTAATLIGSRHKLNVFVREKINTWMNPWKDSDAIVTKFNAKYRESVGFSDYLGIVHITGAA